MRPKSVRERAAEMFSPIVFTRADLVASGMSWRDIRNAIERGQLVRFRRDRYASSPVDDDVAEAVRIGGRLSCISLLAGLGVFVHVHDRLHVHAAPGSSRLRAPRSKRTVVHWTAWSREPGPAHVMPLIDALAHAVRCQGAREAVATVDSVLHHGLLEWEDVVTVFAQLPVRYAVLLGLVDASAASGPETFMRLLLRSLGVSYATQVLIPDVGYVDFLVDGWLIIECDSREFHQGWEKQVEDRRRDTAAAMRGYVTIRPVASDILRGDAAVRRAVAAVIATLGPRFT